MSKSHEIITPRNMNVPIARLLTNSAKRRTVIVYNPEMTEGRRFTFMDITKLQSLKLIEGGNMPAYDDEFKSLTFDMGDYKY